MIVNINLSMFVVVLIWDWEEGALAQVSCDHRLVRGDDHRLRDKTNQFLFLHVFPLRRDTRGHFGFYVVK